MKALGGIVILCLGLAIAGCGGDDDSAETNSQAPGEAGAVEPTAPSKDAKALVGCLEKEGYKPAVQGPPPEGVPGSEFGSTGTVTLDVGQGERVVALFLQDPKRAEKLGKQFSKSVIGTDAHVEVIGSVYLTATKGKPKEFEAVRSCVK